MICKQFFYFKDFRGLNRIMDVWGGSMTKSNLHERDLCEWCDVQVNLLKNRNLDQLDIEHLIEEIQDLGDSKASELESCLRVLFMHLLKWKTQLLSNRNDSALTTSSSRRANFRQLPKMLSVVSFYVIYLT